MSRTLLERVGGFDSSLWVSEDSDLILRLYEVARFECIDRVLVDKFQQDCKNGDSSKDESSYREKVL